MPKNFAQKHHFILAKAFEVPRNFSRKVSCVGVGGRCPDIRRTQKTRRNPRFYFFVICWNCVMGPCFKGLFVKSPLKIRKNFPSKTSLHFGESFWDSKGLFSKSFLRQGLGRKPQLIMQRQTARHLVLFLYINKKQADICRLVVFLISGRCTARYLYRRCELLRYR